MLSGLFWTPCSSGSLPPAPFFSFSSKELTRVSAEEARCTSANSCSLKACEIGKSWECCSPRGYSSGSRPGPGPFHSDGFLNSSGAAEQSFAALIVYARHSFADANHLCPNALFYIQNRNSTHLLRVSPVHSLYSCCCKFI